jgi:LysR family cyn operon transcriptional activator
VRALGVEALALVVGKSHLREKKRGELSLREFGGESLVLLNEEFATRSYIARYCREHGTAPRIAI